MSHTNRLSTDQRATRLTEEQKQQFTDWGYITRLPLFDDAGTTDLQRRFGEFCDLLPPDVDISRINNWHKANRWIYDLCHIPAILNYVEDLLGPNFFHWGASFFCKFPGDQTEVPWHQDAQYWPLHPHRAVTIWLAFFDTDETNGAMRVVQGSHHLGEVAHQEVQGKHFMLGQQVVASAFDPHDVVSLCLRAGQISIHDDAIIHGSPANCSNHVRAGLTLRYSATDSKCDLAVWPSFESYPARGVDEYRFNPVGKVPQADGFPIRAQQNSSDFS